MFYKYGSKWKAITEGWSGNTILMTKPVQTDSTAVEAPAITEIRRPNSFGNLFVDSFGNGVSGSIAILDTPDWQRKESEE